jgi:hypothetical protein
MKPRRVATDEELRFARQVAELNMPLFKIVCYYV